MNSRVTDVRKEIDAFTDFLPSIRTMDLVEFDKQFHQRLGVINTMAQECPDERQELYQYAFRVWSPELDKGQKQSRARNKPAGYPGDFLIIDWIYANDILSTGEGVVWDQFFNNLKGVQAVRNRKEYFGKVITDLVSGGIKNTRVLDIASGPCRDLKDAVSKAGGLADGLYVHCVDSDSTAIEYGKKMVQEYAGRINFDWSNLNVYRLKTDMKYQLVWSAGLFDYLNDKLAVALIARMWNWAEPGGKIIVGNFCPNNPNRDYMEWALAWFLIHRTEQDMLSLFTQAGIPADAVSFYTEPVGINLFAIADKKA